MLISSEYFVYDVWYFPTSNKKRVFLRLLFWKWESLGRRRGNLPRSIFNLYLRKDACSNLCEILSSGKIVQVRASIPTS